MGAGSAVSESLKVMLLGLGTVFVGLILLIFVIELLHWLVNGSNKKEKKVDVQHVDEQAKLATDNNYEQEGNENEEELVAVISAAIAAMLETSTCDFVVKSIRRVPAATPRWNQVSRQEQVRTRL
ncbi:MAG: OadG family transporter subunit [Xylanivirga thermophila]|jgi:glutaconyl-CoA/methylmalonyl-CoA decarboxylase subunit delta|uniref:OadG family protein n=1 Tax=Xylanivirga thermophila TaxID=2496273 RepID=UPI0039F530F3